MGIAHAGLGQRGATLVRQLRAELESLPTLVRRGVIAPMGPGKLAGVARAFHQWGITPTLGFSIGAIRHPQQPAIIDELGELSYAELADSTTRLASGLASRGVRGDTKVGILCRNHRGMVQATLACAKLGADTVMLNTGLSPQQLESVINDQNITVLITDNEFADGLTNLPTSVDLILAWVEGTSRRTTLNDIIGCSPSAALPRLDRNGRIILLTSGTTGTPKGAGRPHPPGLSPAAVIFSRVPFNAGERMLISAPLFHTWGFAAFQFAAVLGATMVLDRKFDPVRTLETVQRHRCTSMFAVPVMLQRILDLAPADRDHFDTSSLRIIAAAGSALPSGLTARILERFGDVLYNFYGTTEVSWATIATPADLRHNPDTAGKPCRNTQVRIIDEHGRPASDGETGRVFVGNNMLFEGYTNGSSKEVVDGMMATGDLGWFDAAGRLYLAGREDDMIVSGGENVYPKETEDVIAALPGVLDAAVIGVPDPDFGQRLAAFVVTEHDEDPDADEVRASVRARLSRFAVPREVIYLRELPRNATGKVVPRELRTQWEAATGQQ